MPPSGQTRRTAGGGPGGTSKSQRGGDSNRVQHSRHTAAGYDMPAEVMAVLATSVAQLDGLVSLSTDAILHSEPLTVADLIAPLDRIAQRQAAALAAGGAR